MANQRGTKNISAVGGIKLPTVDIFIAGYRAGAQRCVPGTTVQVGYSQDFVAQDKCKEIALNQIDAGLAGRVPGRRRLRPRRVSTRLRKSNVWGVGVDRDQAVLGPHILTSAVKRVDQAVFLTAGAVKAGKFKGGTDAVFNLKNKGVGIGKISPRVPKRFVTRMNALRPLLMSGKIKAPKKL